MRISLNIVRLQLMAQDRKYPERSEIKVEWTLLHIAVLIVSLVIIPFAFVKFVNFHQPFLPKFLSVLGLLVDIVGVTIATLKTPYYGSFHDGGQIEIWRREEEDKYFKVGMFLIAIGAFFQAFGNIL